MEFIDKSSLKTQKAAGPQAGPPAPRGRNALLSKDVFTWPESPDDSKLVTVSFLRPVEADIVLPTLTPELRTLFELPNLSLGDKEMRLFRSNVTVG